MLLLCQKKPAPTPIPIPISLILIDDRSRPLPQTLFLHPPRLLIPLLQEIIASSTSEADSLYPPSYYSESGLFVVLVGKLWEAGFFFFLSRRKRGGMVDEKGRRECGTLSLSLSLTLLLSHPIPSLSPLFFPTLSSQFPTLNSGPKPKPKPINLFTYLRHIKGLWPFFPSLCMREG